MGNFKINIYNIKKYLYNGYDSLHERGCLLNMDINVNAIFAKRIRELRESRGLGVRQLANELGISHSSISMYENEKREPTVSVCKLFADYFGVSCDYLIGITDYPYKKED